MASALRHRPGAWMTAGVLIGLVIGSLLPDSPAHAVATDRFENFAMCTAPMDNEVEAIYFLDFGSGELKASVLSTSSAKFTTFYARNILGDFQLQDVDKPRFLMISGLYTQRRLSNNLRLGSSAVYVAELATGQVNAYSVPWSTTRSARVDAAVAPIGLLDFVQMRKIVREGG